MSRKISAAPIIFMKFMIVEEHIIQLNAMPHVIVSESVMVFIYIYYIHYYITFYHIWESNMHLCITKFPDI